MNIDDNDILNGTRDRLVMGKGQACAALYAVLAHRGFLARENLWSYRRLGGMLQGRPDSARTPGVDAASGVPGLGLGIAVGMALARRMNLSKERVFCIVGDEELQEGGLWESALTAVQMKLSNLVLIVDRNGSQRGAPMEKIKDLNPVPDKFQAFGWRVFEAQGHDYQSLSEAFEKCVNSQEPCVIIAHTMRGKGISFIEQDSQFSESNFSPELAERALEELNSEGPASPKVNDK